MLHHRSRHRHSLLAFVTQISIALGVAGMPLAVADEEPPTAAERAVAHGNEPFEQLQLQLDELKLRIQGMEGKLKDSANARKASDQARMDAERRLAEGNQKVEQLETEVLETQRLRQELASRLAAQEAEIARLQSELQTAAQATEEMGARLSALQGQLPVSEGGTLTAEEARLAAAEAMASLREARQKPDGDKDPATNSAVAAATNRLHDRQLGLANVIAAQSLYQVRPSDTLAVISSRFYGNTAQWRQIHEANHHVLEDPDRLIPGMTLVIP